MRTILCLLLLCAAGCGQKGQLYLPSEPPAAVPADAPEISEAPDGQEKEEDGDRLR